MAMHLPSFHPKSPHEFRPVRSIVSFPTQLIWTIFSDLIAFGNALLEMKKGTCIKNCVMISYFVPFLCVNELTVIIT